MKELKTEQDIDAMIFGLSEKCPFDDGNPEDCQLHDIRKYSLHERMLMLDQLTFNEKENIFSKHKDCLKIKESKL